MKSNSYIISRIIDGIKVWVSLNLLLILFMLVVRIIFFIETATRINVSISQFLNILLGFKYDLLLASHIIAWSSLIFLIFYYFFPKTSVKIYKVLIFTYAIISTLLTEYFCNLTMPLDHVIFAYSVESLKATISSSSSFSIIPILYIAISIFLFVIISRLWKKVKINNIIAYIVLVLSIVISISFNYGKIIREERFVDIHAEFILATNQPSYSVIKIYDYLTKEDNGEKSGFEIIEEATKSYQQLNSQFNYPYLDYPFYRKADYQDVLGCFMNKPENGEMPNFVFIIAESFGQCLTGVENPSVSFTPYIDSLKNESLYWRNCLAATERTFGVLPTIFASTPHGKKGFAYRYYPITPHNSLLKDFKKNNYDISYYYGCYRDLDRYDKFLKTNEVEKIFIPEQGNVDEEIYNLMRENNRWGIDDKELFDIVVRDRQSSDNDKPFVDIVMTLSTHEPFIILEGQEKYEQKAREIFEKANVKSTKEKNIIQKNMNVFACYLYMDECINELINSYKRMGKYDNTIFIITGDHRMGMLSTGSTLRSFNVPLLIHSSLLNKNKQMDAVVSHYDLTPTINAYLSNNFDYKVDEYCHWLGHSLDTVEQFRNNVRQAFMLNNRDVVNYIHGDYFISRSRLFEIESDLCLSLIDDEAKYQELKKELDEYNLISAYAVESNFLNSEGESDFVDVAEYHFDIDNTSDKVFNKLTVDSLDNKFVYFDEKQEYISLYPYYEVKDNYTKFIVSVSFDLQSYTDKKLPLLVYSIGDFNKSVPLVSLQNEGLNTGEKEHFVNRITINGDDSFKGEKLKIYFKNSSKTAMMFDNIKVLIKAGK